MLSQEDDAPRRHGGHRESNRISLWLAIPLMKIRFGLRSLALLIAVVCVALWAVPVAMDWYYWHKLREIIANNMDDLAKPGEPSIFLGVVKDSEYYLSNHEIRWDPAANAMTELVSNRRNDAVFVTFPRKAGRWASTPDEVIQMLKGESSPNKSND